MLEMDPDLAKSDDTDVPIGAIAVNEVKHAAVRCL